MPYFIICPVYALLVIALLLVATVLFFFKKFRFLSSYILCGTIGTFPGFVIGNVVFWLIVAGVATLLQKPMQQVTSDLAKGVAAGGFILLFIGGLALANISGFVAGFFGGIWLRWKFSKRKSKMTGQEKA
jgi:ABC-type antimicrobial peptide transport system permease subunit